MRQYGRRPQLLRDYSAGHVCRRDQSHASGVDGDGGGGERARREQFHRGDRRGKRHGGGDLQRERGVQGNSSGFPQIAMTSSTVTCVITATKAGDANSEPTTSAPVSVIATEPVPASFATLHAFTGPDGLNPAGPMVQAGDGSGSTA